MNPIRYLSIAVVLVLGCQGMPTVTRTGDVKDVIIGDSLASGKLLSIPVMKFGGSTKGAHLYESS